MGHTPDCEPGTSTIDVQMTQSGQSPLHSWPSAPSFTARSAMRNDDFWDKTANRHSVPERPLPSKAAVREAARTALVKPAIGRQPSWLGLGRKWRLSLASEKFLSFRKRPPNRLPAIRSNAPFSPLSATFEFPLDQSPSGGNGLRAFSMRTQRTECPKTRESLGFSPT